MIRTLKARLSPSLEKNIFNAIHDVNVDTLVGFSYHGTEKDFLSMFAEEAARQEQERAHPAASL